MYFADLLCTLLDNSDSSNFFNSASLQDESDDFSFCLCAAVLVWVLFVVGVDWLLDVSPSDKPDGSSRVLGWDGLLALDVEARCLGSSSDCDRSPDDKPDCSSRVLGILMYEVHA